MLARNLEQLYYTYDVNKTKKEESKNQINIFFSYSHKDETYKEILDGHFAAMKRQSIIKTWNDRKLSPGSKFDDEIMKQINAADIAILMLSPHFINSNYIMDKEVALLEERIKNGDALLIIPIFTIPVDLTGFSFANYQSPQGDVNGKLRYLNSKEFEINETCYNIVSSLRKTITKILESRN